MKTRLLFRILCCIMLPSGLPAQALKRSMLVTDTADPGEGSVYLTGEVSGSGTLSCQVQLYKGTSQASAVIIPNAFNAKNVKTGRLLASPPVNGNPSIRISHSYLLKEKMNGLLVPGTDEAVSILAKVTLGEKVFWTPPITYKFATRDRLKNAQNMPRFRPIRCDIDASTELYEVDGRARYLLVADVNHRAKVNIHTGPIDGVNKNLIGLQSFSRFEGQMDESTVAFFNASMFTGNPKNPTQTLLGLKSAGVWRDPSNKGSKRRAMRLDLGPNIWNVEYKSFEADAANFAALMDFKWPSDGTGGNNTLVGYIPHDASTVDGYKRRDAQTFVGASAKGIAFYVYSCDSGSSDGQTPQGCKDAMIDAGIPNNSLIWLDGGNASFLQTSLNGDVEQWVDTDVLGFSHDIPVMISVSKR